MVILLGNGILCGKPQILFDIQRIVETASREALNRAVDIVLSLDNARAGKVVYQFLRDRSVFRGVDQFHLACSRNLHLGSLIHISVSMSGDGNGLLPVLHAGFNPFYHDGRTENRSVQDRPDRSVGALPHLLQIVLLHAGRVGGNGGALDCDAVLLCGFRGIHRYLIICGVSVLQAQIIILCLQVDEGSQKLVLDHLPENSGHLISVHLHQRGFHLNFIHHFPPFLQYCTISCFYIVL